LIAIVLYYSLVQSGADRTIIATAIAIAVAGGGVVDNVVVVFILVYPGSK